MSTRQRRLRPTAGLVPGAGLALLLAATLPPPVLAQEGPEVAPASATRRQVVVEAGDSEPSVRVFFVGDEGHQVRIEPGRASRGYLGVGLLDLTPELRRFFGSPEDRGVMVSRVEAESPAAAAGLAVGDILTALDGEPVEHAGQVTRRISGRQEGDEVRIDVRRARAARTLTARVTERSRQQVDLGYAFWSCAPGEECEGAFADGGTAYRRVIPVAPEQLNEAVRELNRTFDSPGWQARMRRFQEGEESYEVRLRRLEERIRELEELLAEAGGG